MEPKDTVAATTELACESARGPEDPELAECILDRYRIDRRLGAGGMGVVYAARDLRLGRDVAIKLVRAGVVSSGDARLAHEARAMAKLRHPNVVTLFDIGTIGDRLFVVMELVDGGTLSEWLKAEPRSWRQIATVFLQAARGLAAVHAAGFVHRDFKPPNVLIGGDGVVRVSDFGLVRLVGVADDAAELPAGEPHPATLSGAVVGTPGYIAPEQLRNQPIDARADQFSFCVALYAALHGERPFMPKPGSPRSAETLGQLRPIAKPAAPRWLENVIRRGLAARPEARWPSMDSLGAAIQRGLRRPRRAILGGAAAAAILAAATAVALRRSDAPAPPRHISELAQHQVTFDGNAHLSSLSPDGSRLVYGASTRVRLVDLDGGQTREFAAGTLVSSRWLPDSSAFDLIVYDGAKDRHYFRILRDGTSLPMPSLGKLNGLSPDGSMTYSFKYSGKNVSISRDGETLRLLPVPGSYTWIISVGWSPDGRRLLVETEDAGWPTLWTLSIEGGDPIRLVEEHASISSPQFVHGGRGVAYLRHRLGDDWDLVLLPIEDGAPAGDRRVVADGFGRYSFHDDGSMLFSRDGRRVAYTRARGPAQLWLTTIDDPAAEHPSVQTRRLLTDAVAKQSPAISPNGTQVSYTALDGPSSSIFTVSVDGGIPHAVPGLPDGDKGFAAWSPDGKSLAFLLEVEARRSLWVVPATGGPARRLAATAGSHANLGLSWDLHSPIAYHRNGNRNYGLVDAATGAERPLLHDEGRGWAFDPVWSPDGRQVALLLNRPEHWGIWLISEDGKDERPLQLAKGALHPKAWSADGRFIFAQIGHDDRSEWPEIYRVPVSGGAPEVLLTLPIENLGECAMSAAGRQVACTAGGESDVWLVDDAGQLLRR